MPVSKMKKFLTALFALTALAAAEPHTHDGFFMNYAVGAGYQDYKIRSGNREMEIDGVASEFDMKIGAAFSPDMIVHFTVLSIENENDLSYEGDTYPIDGITSILFGAGATHYTPANVFFSFSVGFVQTSSALDANFDFTEKNKGIGLEAEVGKEWWVGYEWGLGGAIAFTYIKNFQKQHSSSGYGFSLMLSLTYN